VEKEVALELQRFGQRVANMLIVSSSAARVRFRV
jgi:hypothetical protein